MAQALKTTTSTPRRRRITERQQRQIVDRTMAAVNLRDTMRQTAAARRRFERDTAPWRRIAGKVIALAMVASLTGIVVSHALAGG
jgi:hypothetical protein